ncbi:hypothetical protein [Paenibacillus peoriae]|nr:hypothetical protein [Paenibacillus peoriae]
MYISINGFEISKVDNYNGNSDYGEDANPKLVEKGVCKHNVEYKIFEKKYSLEKGPYSLPETIYVNESQCQVCRTKDWRE